MKKSKLDQEIERSRAKQAPERGARVFYPMPLPPIAHAKFGPTDDPVPQWIRPPGFPRDEEFDPTFEGELNPMWAKAKVQESIVPTGVEEWRAAKVVGVEHRLNTLFPDDYMVVLEPEGGEMPLSLPVVFVRAEPPA